MSRLVRINEGNTARELTFSCFQRRPLLEQGDVKDLFINAFKFYKSKYDFHVLAYVLMPEHVHLLVWSDSTDVVSAISKLKSYVAYDVLKLWKNSNDPRLDLCPIIQGKRMFWLPGGGYDRNIYSSFALQASIDYIHLNPCRRGLADSPHEYKWSSAKAYIEGESDEIVTFPGEL